MRPLLLILLLNITTLPLIASEVSVQAENAISRYHGQLLEFSRTGELGKYKMACLELRMASTRLKTKLNKLQTNPSSHTFLLAKDKINSILAGGCNPYGL